MDEAKSSTTTENVLNPNDVDINPETSSNDKNLTHDQLLAIKKMNIARERLLNQVC